MASSWNGFRNRYPVYNAPMFGGPFGVSIAYNRKSVDAIAPIIFGGRVRGFIPRPPIQGFAAVAAPTAPTTAPAATAPAATAPTPAATAPTRPIR